MRSPDPPGGRWTAGAVVWRSRAAATGPLKVLNPTRIWAFRRPGREAAQAVFDRVCRRRGAKGVHMPLFSPRPPGSAPTLTAQPGLPVVGDRPVRVVGDLPPVPVGIDEDAGVAAPEGLSARSRYLGAGGAGLLQHLVDLLGGAGVVGGGDPA